MIVWLASYPRSGNTYFRILLNACCGIKTFSMHGDSRFHHLGAVDTVGSQGKPADLDAFAFDDEIHFVKTHYMSDRCPGKAIYIYRDGRDAILSLAKFGQPLNPPDVAASQIELARRLERIILGEELRGKWGEHVEDFLWQPAEEVALVRFEDMIREPMSVLRNSLTQLQLPIAVQESPLPTFGDLNRNWPIFFRTGTPGEGRRALDKRLHELFWEHHGRAMDRLNYPRETAAAAA